MKTFILILAILTNQDGTTTTGFVDGITFNSMKQCEKYKSLMGYQSEGRLKFKCTTTNHNPFN